MARLWAFPLLSVLCLAGCTGGAVRQNAGLPQPGVAPQQERPRHERAAPAAEGRSAPGSFDFYLLNLSWSPEYCHSHAGAAECAQHAGFVLHGLWPENADGTYPENCSTAPGPADPAHYGDLYPEAGLLQHEWKTHGTCTGLSADAYFGQVRSADRAVTPPPALQHATAQLMLSTDQIANLVLASNPALGRENVVVSCGNNYLTAVEVCLDKTLRPISCGAVRSCRSQAVRIPAP